MNRFALPIAICVGVSLYLLFADVAALDGAARILGPVCEKLLPITIFLTLFVTFSKVDFHLMRLRRWHAAILGTQLLMVALLLIPILTDSNIQSSNLHSFILPLLICVIAPCASASPVVTAKLGGDLTQMTTFVLLSSAIASLLIPATFPLIEPHEGLTFAAAFITISRRLWTVLLLPLLFGAIVRHSAQIYHQFPRFFAFFWFLRKPYLLFVRFLHTPDLGYYLWSISLAITAGITMRNIVHSAASATLLTAIAVGTMLIALLQFGIGRAIGHRMGRPVCCGQAMFQKNTGLAIWIAYTYLTPIAAVGAGCYVLWQNIINSVEIYCCSLRTCPGVTPNLRLKIAEKWETFLKPTSKQESVTRRPRRNKS